ncbi:MAG TPA: enoyl-CoA hydratase-related protein [Acidimicrobiales bacterium]
MTDVVLYREDDGVAYLTLNRPESLNALNPSVFSLLGRHMDFFAAESTARVLILHGKGSSFAAGADIKHYVDLTPERYADFMRVGNAIQQKFIECPKPVIASVHGYALGGGLELALVCDLIVAAPDAQLGLPEVKLGLLPGGGGTQRLARLIGPIRAAEVIMAARRFSGEEAASWGLALGVRDSSSALEAAEVIARRIARQAPLPVRAAKTLIRTSRDTPTDTGLAVEQSLGAAIYGSADAREGIAAFVEKRSAQFGGDASQNGGAATSQATSFLREAR